LLKFRNSLRSNSRNFFTQERPASTLWDGNFYKGHRLLKQGTRLQKYCVNGTVPVPRSVRSPLFSALLEKDGPQDGKKAPYVKKSVLFERSEFCGF